jgi:hypothetical protein
VKLDIRHTFPVTPDEFWAMFWDEEFERRNAQGSTVAREMLWERNEGAVRVQRWRYTSMRPVPPAMAKIVGVERVSYEQDNRYDPVTKQLTWKVIPMVMAFIFPNATRNGNLSSSVFHLCSSSADNPSRLNTSISFSRASADTPLANESPLRSASTSFHTIPSFPSLFWK